MAELRAGSTAHVTIVPVAALESLTLTVTDDQTGLPVDIGQPANPSGDGLAWAFDAQSSAVPMELSGHILKLEWRQASRDGQVRTSVEYVSVLGPEVEGDLCTIADVRAYATIPDSQDDAAIARVISAVSQVIRSERGMPTFTVPPVIETRQVAVYGDASFNAPELVSATAITDADGVPLTFIQSTDRQTGFVNWVQLHDPVTGIINVTGTWGYHALPAVVVQAAVAAVSSVYMRDVADFGGGGTPYGRLDLLSKEVLDMLSRVPGRAT